MSTPASVSGARNVSSSCGVGVGDGAMRMSYFSTKDPPLRVARYYRTIWEQQGLSVHHKKCERLQSIK